MTRSPAVGPISLLVGLVVLWGARPAVALDPDRAMSQYLRTAWGPEHGLVGGAIGAIAQTPEGYLWLGTEKGLIRFDGVTFTMVADAGPSTRSRAPVLGLIADSDGNLWIRRAAADLVRHRDGAFTRALPDLSPPEDAFTAMAVGRDGALLLAGLVYGAVKVQGGRAAPLTPPAAMPARSPVISMTQAEDGTLWMGTRDAGLFALANGRVQTVTKGLQDRKVNTLLALDGSEVWVGTDAGVVRWNGRALTSEGVPAALSRLQVLAMTRDRGSNVWIGTPTGLLRVNAKGVSALRDREDSPRAVTVVFEDREGNLWIGRGRAIERLRDSSFTTYSRGEGLPSETNGPVYVDSRGRTWFAPAEGGLYWLDGARVAPVREAGLDADVVYSIAPSREGLWVGRRRGGLTQLRFEGEGWRARSYTSADGLPADSVFAVHEDRDGGVWAGTLNHGAAWLSNGRFHTYTKVDGLPSNTIASIAETPDGAFWFATPAGLAAYAQGRWRAYAVSDGLPSEDVYSLLVDSRGVLWAGTADGVAYVTEGRIRKPSALRGAGPDRILGLAEDRAGHLWIAGATHLLRVRRDTLLSGSSAVDAREFGPADGLQGLGATKRHRSVVADGQGRIWFSMDRGLSVVDPARLADAARLAMVRILGLSIDGTPTTAAETVHVPAGRQRVAISYAGVSLSVPDQVRFRCRLDGFDEQWSAPVATREAVYTNLAPRSYRFRVRASTEAGADHGPEAQVLLVVEPAIWQTVWFRAGVALLAAVGMAALYRQRLRRLTRQLNLRFEERLAERTRIAQELHDTLLQEVLSASMLLHLAVDHVPEDFPERTRLRRALELMGRVIEQGRNAVRGLRSTTSVPDELERAFRRVGEELAATEQTSFRVTREGPALALHPLIRDEVYKIGREALVNALRHSGAGRVDMEVVRGPRHLKVVVRDDGRGMEPEVLRRGRDGHWGLSGMRERSERIGARLKISSRIGEGTEVELVVPGHVAFEGRPSRLPDWVLRWYGRHGAIARMEKRARE
jgi:ligand-binding sensor domain-containing protein/signal transduction histidine kinase